MPLPCLRTSRTQLSELTIQYSWRYARYDQSKRTIRTRAVLVEWRYIRYESIRPKYHTNCITYHPGPSVQNVLLGTLNKLKNDHSDIKIAESAISHRIFWLQWKWHTSWPEKQKWVVCFSLRVVYVAIRFVLIPVRDDIHKIYSAKICMSYGWFGMPSIRIGSVHYVLVHMFQIAIRLVRLIRKRYLYGSDEIHTLQPMCRLLLIRIHTHQYNTYVNRTIRIKIRTYESQTELFGGGGRQNFLT